VNAVVLLLTVAALALAQSPSFDVASIKPNISGSGSTSESTRPGRVICTNVTASMLIESAFGIKDFQISGAPGWVGSDHFDINAATGTSRDLNDKELQPYFQALLAERFHFRFHRETKELQVYSLLAAKTGAKLAPHSGEGDSSNNISNGSGKSSVTSTNVSMESFANILGGRLDHVVIDHTGLKGAYDIKLHWSPDPAADSTEPSLFTALQEQLGLKLETTKGPVEIIVIDNLEKPTEN
jgi:uncharacterized protein (TIGR03435 family)